MAQRTSGSSGIGFAGVLGIVFVILKLTGVIDWHWAIVLAPFYAGIAIVAVLAILATLVVGIKAAARSVRARTEP